MTYLQMYMERKTVRRQETGWIERHRDHGHYNTVRNRIECDHERALRWNNR